MATDVEVVEISDCRARLETKKGERNQGGLLVQFDDLDEEWLPKSQISEDSEVYKEGTSGTLIVSKWIADKKNLTSRGEVRYIGAS